MRSRLLPISAVVVLGGFVILITLLTKTYTQATPVSIFPIPVSTLSPPEPVDPWVVSRSANTVTARDFVRSGRITIRQVGHTLTFDVHTDQYLEAPKLKNKYIQTVPVVYKFDNEKSVKQNWLLAKDNESVDYPGDPTPFIAHLQHAKTFSILLPSAGKTPETLSFDIQGLPDVFAGKHK